MCCWHVSFSQAVVWKGVAKWCSVGIVRRLTLLALGSNLGWTHLSLSFLSDLLVRVLSVRFTRPCLACLIYLFFSIFCLIYLFLSTVCLIYLFLSIVCLIHLFLSILPVRILSVWLTLMVCLIYLPLFSCMSNLHVRVLSVSLPVLKVLANWPVLDF